MRDCRIPKYYDFFLPWSGREKAQVKLENPADVKAAEKMAKLSDLNDEAQKDFADYFRQGKLIISAVATYNASTGKAEVRQYGQRLAMSEFKDFFAALGDGKRVAELKEQYNKIREHFPELPVPGTKDAMTQALRDYEAAHPEKLEQLSSEDQFYGVSKGANRLAKYIQWVYVPAVKDVTLEQVETRNTALGKLLARTVQGITCPFWMYNPVYSFRDLRHHEGVDCR